MSVYSAYRDWADGIMRESAIRAPAPILFPAVLPVLDLVAFGIRQPFAIVAAATWATVVIAWGAWRYWRILVAEAVRSDGKHHRETKYRLSKEYRANESTTAEETERR